MIYIAFILPQSIQIDPIDRSIYVRLCTWSQTAELGTSEIEPPRPLPSIGLSHLPVWKKIELLSRFNTEVYGKSRTKPRMQSEIRRVTNAWNTPARLVSFPGIRYVYKTSAYSDAFETNSRYTEYERPATSGLRFNTDLYGAFGPRM